MNPPQARLASLNREERLCYATAARRGVVALAAALYLALAAAALAWSLLR